MINNFFIWIKFIHYVYFSLKYIVELYYYTCKYSSFKSIFISYLLHFSLYNYRNFVVKLISKRRWESFAHVFRSIIK